jgi:hypothetical protein
VIIEVVPRASGGDACDFPELQAANALSRMVAETSPTLARVATA